MHLLFPLLHKKRTLTYVQPGLQEETKRVFCVVMFLSYLFFQSLLKDKVNEKIRDLKGVQIIIIKMTSPVSKKYNYHSLLSKSFLNVAILYKKKRVKKSVQVFRRLLGLVFTGSKASQSPINSVTARRDDCSQ